MNLVTQTDCIMNTINDDAAIRILAQAGFDAIDWSFHGMTDVDSCVWWHDDWKEYAQHLKDMAAECSITFRQAHAPFPTSKGEEPFDTVVMQRIRRSMEVAAFLGIQYIIIHPRQHLPYAKNKQLLWEENLELYRSLIPLCEELNIHVCTENMWQYDNNRQVIVDSVCAPPEEFCGLLDAIDSPWIVGCLDIGHCALTGHDPADFIRAMGPKRLKALHVHDVDYRSDKHNMPFMEKLDWESVCAALGEIGYEGDFTFEADNFLYKFPNELKADAAALMAKTGRYLISRVEAHRK